MKKSKILSTIKPGKKLKRTIIVRGCETMIDNDWKNDIFINGK